MNIYDISQKAGVSIATVSRVLNKSTKVSDKTKQKVLDVINEHNYIPNRFAQSLALNSMKTIGILCANSSDMFFGEAINNICIELRKHDYDNILCFTGYSLASKRKYIDILISKSVDAIILLGSDFIEANIDENQYIIEASKSVPLILVNGYLDSPNIYSVTCNDSEIVREVTDKLIKSGSEKILFLNRKICFGFTQKLKGFMQANKENNIVLEDWQILTYFDEISIICEKLKSLPRMSAIITSDDELAIASIKFAKKEGIKIPQDLQIIGYNNSRLTNFCEPELSSIDNNLKYSCISAVNILMGVLNQEKTPSKTIISGEFIERETTRRII